MSGNPDEKSKEGQRNDEKVFYCGSRMFRKSPNSHFYISTLNIKKIGYVYKEEKMAKII